MTPFPSSLRRPPARDKPVFLDETGRRWRLLRLLALGAGVVSSLVAAVVVFSLLVPPAGPALAMSATPPTHSHLVMSKTQRRRLDKRLQLWFELRRHRAPPAVHASRLPIQARTVVGKAPEPGQPIVAGFYVNWDDNSLASLAANVADMDWVICEWGFLMPGGDSLRMNIDRRVPYTIAQKIPDERQRPWVFAMISNYDSTRGKWDTPSLRHLLTDKASRDRAITQLTDTVMRYGLGGVTLDFEEVPPSLTDAVVQFEKKLKANLAPKGRLVTQAVSFNDTDAQLAKYGAVADKLFFMLYDEHYGGGDPGPVASQEWFVRTARHMMRFIPPNKAILALGAYGYDWNDSDDSASAMTFQDVMSAVRDAAVDGQPAAIHFDTAALNPYATWRDPDSTDHVDWYLDGVTAYNEIIASDALGAGGVAVWRLGSEDPAIWSVIGKRGIDAPAESLSVIPSGYDPEFQPKAGTGELLELRARPTDGAREIKVDPVTRLVVDEDVTRYATPWIIRRFGSGSPHKIALTFDDGPDGRYTSAILDTLKSRHAPATFFVIGQNAEAHIPLLRREYAEGHEIGNHTFTHPNLAFASDRVTKLQLDATERLLEAALGRRTAFFRPPYFGDAEPTTPDELEPIAVATDRGYISVGLRIDAEDWQSEYDQLRNEVQQYSVELAAKPHCVVFTKMDLLGDDEPPPIEAPDAFGVFAISAAARTGLDELTLAWWRRLLEMKKAAATPVRDVHLP